MTIADNRFFLLLMVAATALFGWVLWPLYGAILWGIVIAILFAPVNRELVRLTGGRRTLAAFACLALIVLLVILPLALIGTALAREATALYGKLQSGNSSALRYAQDLLAQPPDWVNIWLDRFGIGGLADLEQKLSSVLMRGSQYVAGQAIDIGQSTLEFTVNLFVMLYLLLFLLRDGESIAARIRRASPLPNQHESRLVDKFAVVIRATVKGNLLIALIQGTLGGLMFYLLGVGGALLWGVVMVFMSLVPAVGAGVVWLPVAIYLLATGAYVKGGLLIAYGALVIGLVDNFLRPVLVGKDTRMPDYVVLISTLGGLQVFGLNGFVIGPVIAAMFIAVWDIYAEARGAQPQAAKLASAGDDAAADELSRGYRS